MNPITRWIPAACLAAALMPAVAPAQELHTTLPEALGVVGSGSQARSKNEVTGHLADRLGDSWYDLDAVGGTLRYYVDPSTIGGPAGSNASGSASAGFQLRLENRGSTAITFAEGAFSLDFSVAYDLQPTTFAQASTTLMFGLGPAGTVLHRLERRGTEPTGQYLFFSMPPSMQRLVTVNTASGEALDITWRSAAYTLPAGQTVALFVNAGSTAYLSGDAGVAIVDSLNSLHLHADLPPGVQFSSDVAMPWISPVPEPAGWAMLLAGAALLAGWRRPAGGFSRR